MRARGRKKELLAEANRKIEVTRWLVRLAADRNLISNRQFVHSCRSLEEGGRMVGGWRKSLASASEAAPAGSDGQQAS